MTFEILGVPANLLPLTNFYADGVGRAMTPDPRSKGPASMLKKFTPSSK